MGGSAFDDDVAGAVIQRVAGGEGLRAVCREAGMPDAWEVVERIAADPDFAARFARAREAGADALFEELQAIADGGNPSDATRARLRVDTLKWRLARMSPKKYSDKVGLMGKSDEPEGPVVARIERVLVRPSD